MGPEAWACMVNIHFVNAYSTHWFLKGEYLKGHFLKYCFKFLNILKYISEHSVEKNIYGTIY